MSGGQGNDLYFVDHGLDTLNENAGEGIDWARSKISFALPDEVEILTLMGSHDIDGTGNGHANRIAGNAGDNELSGLGGDDRILGGDGADVIIGGGGKDVLFGGLGNDVFKFTSLLDSGADAPYCDWIKDMASGDKIDLSEIDAVLGGTDDAFNFVGSGAFQNAGDLRFAVKGANTLVAGDVDGDGAADFTIVLSGVVALQAGDFIL
jgi:Ca2+-binding RTX toxin-like protein